MAQVNATPAIIQVVQALKAEFGSLPDLGLGNCRPKRIDGKLRPDLGYSQHAYANAWDIGLYGKAKQAPVVSWLNAARSQGLPVGLIIWAGSRADHTDHIHVEGSPSISGSPACVSGRAIASNASGIKPGARLTGISPIATGGSAVTEPEKTGTWFSRLTGLDAAQQAIMETVTRGAWLAGGAVAAYLAIIIVVRASAGNVVIDQLTQFGGKAIAGK